MIDAVSITVRFLLYGELALLFGIPLFLAYALKQTERPSGRYLVWQRPLVWLALASVVTSVLGLVAMTAQMTGSVTGAFSPKHLAMVVGTEFGKAWTVRLVALALATALLAMHPWRWFPLAALVLASAIALASLAWGGHAMSFDGAKGTFHLAADIVHLLAFGAWLGAIAALLTLVFRLKESSHIEPTARALASFSTVGSVLVGTVVVTGLINSWALIGLENLALVPTSLYGQLLLAKIALFIGMLVLAAANRFRLTPQLERAIQTGQTNSARAHLRRSLTLELGLAVTILALVSVLGTLAPPVTQ